MQQNKLSRPAELPPIAIPAGDHDHLMALAEMAAQRNPKVADYLAQELCRAELVDECDWDPQVGRIGSRIRFRDLSGGQERSITLVWPPHADADRNRVSVLTPIGAALLGMRSGQSIDWASPGGEPRMLTVLAVGNQDGEPPDAA